MFIVDVLSHTILLSPAATSLLKIEESNVVEFSLIEITLFQPPNGIPRIATDNYKSIKGLFSS